MLTRILPMRNKQPISSNVKPFIKNFQLYDSIYKCFKFFHTFFGDFVVESCSSLFQFGPRPIHSQHVLEYYDWLFIHVPDKHCSQPRLHAEVPGSSFTQPCQTVIPLFLKFTLHVHLIKIQYAIKDQFRSESGTYRSIILTIIQISLSIKRSKVLYSV